MNGGEKNLLCLIINFNDSSHPEFIDNQNKEITILNDQTLCK